MEKREAQEALAVADDLASRMRRKGRWKVTSVFLLGLAMTALTLAYGLTVDASMPSPLFVVLLVPLLLLVIYTVRQPVMPRHHRVLYSIIMSLDALIYTVTVVFGTVFFPGALWWWLPGALLCAVPFFLVGLLNLKAGRDGDSGQ